MNRVPRENFVRDPWFPIALMLIVIIAIWLGIFGPIPGGFAAWLQQWQTLTGALVASVAAFIAFGNTTRTLAHAERLEKHRRHRKHTAVRAVLPLALAQLTEYAERSARALDQLTIACDGEVLPPRTALENVAEPLPSETLKILAEFVEYSDTVDVGVIEKTVARIQIHDSRIRRLVQKNCDLLHNEIVVRREIEGRIIDAAAIYAGAVAALDYARRQQEHLPESISWAAVRSALRDMNLWSDTHPRLYDALARREALSSGPFEHLERPSTHPFGAVS